MRNLTKKIRSAKKGFTLVEVIVAFALTGILLASAGAVLGVFMNSYVRIRSTSEMETAARTIMEKVVSELESTTGGSNAFEDGRALLLEEDGSVWYRDYEGKTVHMLIKDGKLELEAYGEKPERDLDPENIWQYPESFYGNCKIQKMEISKVEDKNFLEVTLEMNHSVGKMEYSMTRMLECYNLEADEIR